MRPFHSNSRWTSMKKTKAENPEERRAWRLDLAALLLLLAGLLVALSLFTDEPPLPTRHSPLTTHRNVLGPGGAWLAQVLTETLGVAVYVLLVSWFVLVVLLFLRRGLFTWSLRLAGWLLLLPCTAVLADYLGPQVFGGPITGSGGTLGAWLRTWLHDALPEPVRYLVVAGCWAVALALTCDVLLAGIIRIGWSWFRYSARQTGTGLARFGRWTWARKNSFALTPAAAGDIPIHHHLEVRPLGNESVQPVAEVVDPGSRPDSASDDERFA